MKGTSTSARLPPYVRDALKLQLERPEALLVPRGGARATPLAPCGTNRVDCLTGIMIGADEAPDCARAAEVPAQSADQAVARSPARSPWVCADRNRGSGQRQ